MKKRFKIIRNNILGFVFGTIFCITVEVAAETLMGSEGVSYSNSKTTETTVDGALDELFSAVEINSEMEALKQSIADLQSKSDVLAEESISLDEVYPVGSIYITETNSNPSDLFGGTWQRYGVGRTLVSTDGTGGQTGGNSTATLSTNNLPSHTHSIPVLSGTTANTGSGYSITYGSATRTTTSNGEHRHRPTNSQYFVTTDNSTAQVSTIVANGHTEVSGFSLFTTYDGAHEHNVSDYYATSISGVESHKHSVTTVANTTGNTGSGSAFSVQNSYITVYIWKRTA